MRQAQTPEPAYQCVTLTRNDFSEATCRQKLHCLQIEGTSMLKHAVAGP